MSQPSQSSDFLDPDLSRGGSRPREASPEERQAVETIQISPAQPQDWQATQKPQGSPLSNRQKSQAGLGSLVLTVVELVRQLMEAQVVRRMEAGRLSEAEIERAGQSLQAMRDQILSICELLDIDPADLNLDLGELGRLLPKPGSYYPDQPSQEGSILELLDRLITTGIVVDGEIDLGVAQLDLIHARLKLVLVSDAKLRG